MSRMYDAKKGKPTSTETKPTASSFSKRAHSTFATMYEQGKTSMVAVEMKRYNLSLLGITEPRGIQSGIFRLATGETILYSGHTHERALYTTGWSALNG